MSYSEKEDLEHLAGSSDPVARVIYHMSMRQLAMLEQLPTLRGMSPWILVDFRSPRRPLPEIQDFWNRKGLLSNEGEKKKAFFVLRSYYESKSRGDSRGEENP